LQIEVTVLTEKAQNRREAFIEELLSSNFTTYFAVTHPKYSTGNKAFRFTPTPVSAAVPYSWKYQEARAKLFELSDLLTVEEAERRNINFVNPALRNFMPAASLPTLRGGIQLLLPGEKAHTHRHSANAFRFILEAPDSGASTVVEGTRIPMHPGDLVMTPNWSWHDHHNESGSHAIWYDGLDVLMAYWMGGVFSQEFTDVAGESYQTVRQTADPVVHCYGPGLLHRKTMLPDQVPASANPLLYYPYSRARQALQDLLEAGAGNEHDGVLMEYVNPINGGPTFPSMNTAIRMVPGKSTLEARHRTENIIFIAMEGSVTFHLPDDQRFDTKPFDVTAIPSWVPYTVTNSDQDAAVLFSNSDRPLFQKLGFYREATV
jgi:gentisate 1,2-dioxygenase